jgi:aminoglycoside phosphotransferase (APT) family kinase protein
VAKRLEASLGNELGAVAIADGVARVGHGLDTYIYGFKLSGEGLGGGWDQPLILRVYPAARQETKARREASVQQFLVEAGYPAPRPLLVAGAASPLGLPFMIMERVAGSPMLERFKNPMAIPGLLRRMAELQTRLHMLPVEGCPLAYDSSLVVRQLAALREQVQRYGMVDLRKPLRWLEENQGVVEDEEPAILHNDFHPLNLMLADDGEMHVLDWSEADAGDRHCDLARTLALFWLAPPLARGPLERIMLASVRGYAIRRYVRCYADRLPVSRARLRYWEAFHGARAWAQVKAIRAGHGEEMGVKPEAVEQMAPGFVRSLRAYFWKRARPS